MAYTTNENIGKVRIKAIRMLRGGKSTREVSRYLGYAQSTIVKWNKRRNEAWHLKNELPTRSSRPHYSPKALPREIVAKIIYTRIETKRCAEVVYEVLKKENVKVSLSSVKRTLSRFNMTKKRSPWRKRRIYPSSPEINHPGALVELDTIHFLDKYNKRSYVHTAIDIYSRYGYAVISKRSNTHATTKFLKKCTKYFPFKIENIQTDNGSEFGLYFTDFVIRNNMTHRHIHPRSPNENGHLERFNRTLQEEIPRHNLCIFKKEDISKYLTHYNTKRMHMGINFKTPKEMVAN